jgi:hypothetical protein
MSTKTQRWRGLVMLVRDAVEHGASAVERVHMATARRPFDVLESIPGVDGPTRVVRAVHDVTVSGVYGTIRLVTRAVGAAVDVGIRVASDAGTGPSDPGTDSDDLSSSASAGIVPRISDGQP